MNASDEKPDPPGDLSADPDLNRVHVKPDSTDPPSGMVTVAYSEFRGLLPHPDLLEQYERVAPGITERLLVQVEQQSAHRQAIENRGVDAEIVNAREDARYRGRGQLFGLGLGALGLIVGGLVAVVTGTTAGATAGSAIGGATLIGLVTVFVVGHRSSTPETQRPEVPTPETEK